MDKENGKKTWVTRIEESRKQRDDNNKKDIGRSLSSIKSTNVTDPSKGQEQKKVHTKILEKGKAQAEKTFVQKVKVKQVENKQNTESLKAETKKEQIKNEQNQAEKNKTSKLKETTNKAVPNKTSKDSPTAKTVKPPTKTK